MAPAVTVCRLRIPSPVGIGVTGRLPVMIGAKKPLVQILQETGCLLVGNNQPAERLQRVIIGGPATAGEEYPQSYVEALQISPKVALRTEWATFSRDAG